MTADHSSGLRRRSPNPNVSPILQPDVPYSPALLSPYINVSGNRGFQDGSNGAGLGAGYNDPLERYHQPSPLASRRDSERRGYPNPTIRLVPSSHPRTHPDDSTIPVHAIRHAHAPPASRSKSNDEARRHSDYDQAAALASLKRHRTDPRSYHSGSRETLTRDAYLIPRDLRERPVPPLPLEIRRSGSGSSGPPSIFSSSSEERTTGQESVGGSSLPTTPRDGRPNSVLSSLKSLSNPFSQSQTSLDAPASPTLSTRSFVSSTSASTTVTSSSARSTTSTLAVPFYPTAFWKSYGAEGKGGVLPKVGEARVNEKLTDKFPAPAPVRAVDTGKKDRWTGYKWILLLSILSVFGYGMAGLTWAFLIMFRVNLNSEVTMVTDPDIVIFLTLASLLCIFASLIGLTGVLLNSRPILAFYNLLLWPTLLSMCLVGYTSYKRGALQLDRKLNQAWSQFLDDGERLRVQNSLRCCGYFNPRHDATYSKKCYPRTTLPGCKSRWMRYERHMLHQFSTAAFGTIPFHLINVMLALLCSNHVNRTFGKGMTPPGYRLRMADVRSNALAVLATLPQTTSSKDIQSRIASKTSLARQPAISHKSRIYSPYRSSGDLGSRSESRMSSRSWESIDTSTKAKETRSRRDIDADDDADDRRRRGWGDVLRQAGPRGRVLREARDRGLL